MVSMNNNSLLPKWMRGAGLATLLVSLTATGHANQRTIDLHDYTNRGFAPDLVSYTVPARGADRLRITGQDGNAVPVQVTEGDKHGEATLSFVASLPPGGSARYTLSDGGGTQPESPVTVTTEEDGCVVANSLLAVRIPAPVDRKFDPPVPAATLPAPIQAFRGADGAWRGSGKLLSDRRVSAMRVQVTANGPAYAEAVYELTYSNGGYYRARLQVIDQVPLVKVREEFDAHELDGRDYWELNMTQGWDPDSMEVASTNGNGAVDPGHVQPLSELGATPNPIKLPWVIISGNSWGPRSVFGLFNTARKKADPAHYPMAGFVPLHRGDWRRAIGIEIQSPDSKQVSLRLPISARQPSWLTELSSNTSPMSVEEHDPNLPVTYSRRNWGLLLAQPALHPLVETARPAGGPCYEARLLFGVVGLDRYKDYILRWPDRREAYPRVVVGRDELPKFLASVDQSPLAPELRKFYFVNKDDAKAKANVAPLEKQLDIIAQYMVSTPTMGHHQDWMGAVAGADDLLSWHGLPDADREEIRAKLALITYLHVEPDVMGHGEGSHLGNPNMSVARQSQMCDFMALLPDHPMFPAWRDYMARFIQYKFGINMTPGGGWFEFGADYYIHSMKNLTYALYGLNSTHASNLDALYNYFDPTWRYYLNLLTPYETRWMSRVIPGEANSAPDYPADFYDPAGAFAERDPLLASQLYWAWEDNGRPLWGGDLEVMPVLGRPWIKPATPELGSQIYPGVGVVFRAHQGPDETYMFLRSGSNWSHWYSDDQNNFTLISRGATLVPFQPFQYYSRDSKKTAIDDFNLYNTIRFGSPDNQYAMGWPDTNVLDHAFLKSVDYAWCSTGYPEWYINPAHRPGYGDPRPLAPGIEQQEGAFHWNRQVMFLKGETANSPNYFVFRDTTSGPGKLASWWNLDLLGRTGNVKAEGSRLAVDTEFPTKLDVLFPGVDSLPIATAEDEMGAGTASPGFRPWADRAAGKPISPNWFRTDGAPVSPTAPPNRENHVLVRLPGKPGGEYFWIAYPRREGEALPQATELAPGAMKIVTPESTDFVFLSSEPMSYKGNDIVFQGCSGTVRLGKTTVTLALTGGHGEVAYQGLMIEGTAPCERSFPVSQLYAGPVQQTAEQPKYAIGFESLPHGRPIMVLPNVTTTTDGEVIEYLVDTFKGPVTEFSDEKIHLKARRAAVRIGPSGVRFIAPDREYVELSSGTVGVRGMGPFDITISNDHVTGTVDGDTRTLMLTKPAGILRPMYHMDDVRWYAAFPDDDAPYREAKTPQYSLALGVTAGRHTVSVDEWTFPELPPLPERTSIRP